MTRMDPAFSRRLAGFLLLVVVVSIGLTGLMVAGSIRHYGWAVGLGLFMAFVLVVGLRVLLLTPLLDLVRRISLAGQDVLAGDEEAARLNALLEEKTRTLQQEIEERKVLEGALKKTKDSLEERVAQRTDDLLRANQHLERDITERDLLEEELRQSQKMEAIGQLAGGIAHDFNNYLTAILGYSNLLLNRLTPGTPDYEDLEQIKLAGERSAALTKQLLAFSRRQVLQFTMLDLNEIVKGMESLLRRLIGEPIRLAFHGDPQLGTVNTDHGQMEQVILNLVVNSRDAMPQGGIITIETQNVELDEIVAGRHTGLTPGSYVMLIVSDTGTGMSGEVKMHLFEPFFTTKPKDKGTGLGLATVFGIIKQSRGHMWVYSEVGRGSTFKICLPRVAKPAAIHKKPDAPQVAGRAKRTETLLLVEDEDPVRHLMERLLKEEGYTVLAAGHGEEALRICADQTLSLHAVITDVVMPGMTGPDLARKIAALRPTVKFLYMSGYTEHAALALGILEGKTAFLQKPFTVEALLQKIREVLDA